VAIGETGPAVAAARSRCRHMPGIDLRTLNARIPAWLLVVGFAACGVLGAVWIQSAASELTGPITAVGHHDFLAFYSVAALVHNGHPQSLYDQGVVTALERAIYPHPTGYAGYMPFNNPPSAAVLLSPLAALSESSARLAWLLVSLVLAITCALILTSGRTAFIRMLGVLVLLATFPAYQTLTEGQWSLVMLLGCLGALAAARRGHPWLAGAALAVLWLNAPVLLLVLVWVLVSRRWRVAGGMAAGVAAVTLATLPWTGIAVNATYVHHLTDLLSAHVSGAGAAGQTAWEGALTNMEGLIGLAAAVFGQQHAFLVDAATACAAIVLVAFLVWAMRGRWGDRPLALRHALATVCLGLLLDPHLYAQDCVLILVLVALVFERIPPERTAGSRAAPPGPFLRIQAGTLLAGAVLMDLSAIDTLGVNPGFLKPIHLLTFVLICGLVILGWPRDQRANPHLSRRPI
jgi:Glycosyltransferase family 87